MFEHNNGSRNTYTCTLFVYQSFLLAKKAFKHCISVELESAWDNKI